MTKVIKITVVSNSSDTLNKINLDGKILGMPYPMKNSSERQFAVNKYQRWFWNSIDLKTDTVIQELNIIINEGLNNKSIVLSSEHHNLKSHVDVVLDYLKKEFSKYGFSITVDRSVVQQ